MGGGFGQPQVEDNLLTKILCDILLHQLQQPSSYFHFLSLATNWCYASGDPHYKGFDRYMIHFMGICGYTLAEPKPGNNLESPPFEVVVRHEIIKRRGV